jgi:hypothetical protein
MRDLKILARPSLGAGRTAVEHAMKTGARLTTRASTQVFTSPGVVLEEAAEAAVGACPRANSRRGGATHRVLCRLAEFSERYAESFQRWWDDLRTVTLGADTARRLVEGVRAEEKQSTWEELCDQRDQMMVAVLKATTFVPQV